MGEARVIGMEVPQPTAGTFSLSTLESLRNTTRNAPVKDSPTASGTGGVSLESQIRFELNRRSYLRSAQKRSASTMNAYSVVLVLLASVTFVGFSQPPGGIDVNGLLKRDTNDIDRDLHILSYIDHLNSSFHLAVTGILVCVSCLAFVIPGDSTSAGGMSVEEIISRHSVGSLSLTDQKKLHSKLIKINNWVSLGLRVARVFSIVTNLCLFASVWSSVIVFVESMFIVTPDELLNERTKGLYGDFHFTYTYYGVFILYLLLLVWNVTNGMIALLSDVVNIINIPYIVNVIKTSVMKAIDIITNMNIAWIISSCVSPSSDSLFDWIRKQPKLWIRWIRKRPQLCVRCTVLLGVSAWFIVHRKDFHDLFNTTVLIYK